MGKKSVFRVQDMKEVLWNRLGLRLWIFIAGLFFLVPIISFAQSTPWEYYSKYKVVVPFSCSGIKFQLSVQEEMRFKEGSRYYNKVPVGLSAAFGKNWRIGVYYAFRNIDRPEGWIIQHLFWPEIWFKTSIGPVRIEDRQRFEFHLTLKEQRYRNLLRLKRPLLRGVLTPWVGDEIRFFFKQERFAVDEVLAGAVFSLTAHLAVNIFYDYRSIKTGGGPWINTHVLQSIVTYRF